MTTYILKMIACSGVFIGLYLLFFQKEKMHLFNRLYLLFSLLISFLIPLIRIDSVIDLPVETTFIDLRLDSSTGVISDTANLRSQTVEASYTTIILISLYTIIAGFLFHRLCRNLFFLFNKTKSGENIAYGQSKLVLIDENQPPHSFLRYVFLNKRKFEEGVIEKEVIQHELTHTEQLHSADRILIELLLVACWFNPFFYLYRRAMQLNHEYMADGAVIRSFKDVIGYQNLLLRTINQTNRLPLSSPFNYFITKKRLTMMVKQTSPVVAFFKILSLIPVITIAVLIFSTRVNAQSKIVSKSGESVAAESPVGKSNTDTVVPIRWVSQFVDGTKEGVSAAVIDEFKTLVEKFKSTPGKKHWKDYSNPDVRRMLEIFQQMNKEQQQLQNIVFTKPLKPMGKSVPGEKQFASLKNPTIYGVWVDGKKVPNTYLEKFSNTDFSNVMISKLYGAAKTNRTYTHQANLMTNAYYEDYYRKAVADKNPMMWVISLPK